MITYFWANLIARGAKPFVSTVTVNVRFSTLHRVGPGSAHILCLTKWPPVSFFLVCPDTNREVSMWLPVCLEGVAGFSPTSVLLGGVTALLALKTFTSSRS